jgi:hypothetical protein
LQLGSKRLIVSCGLSAVSLSGFGDVADGVALGGFGAYSERSAWISGVA